MADPDTASSPRDPQAPSAPAGTAESVEELTPNEATWSLDEVLGELGQRKRALEGMPDGPRPRGEQNWKRRQFIVDFPLQLSYMGVYLATITLLAVGFGALNTVFTKVYREMPKISRYGLGEPLPPSLQDHPDVLLFGLLNFTFVMLLLIGMAVYAIIQSHRIAGPAFRFRRALKQLHRRDYDWFLQLRRKDYLHDLAEQLNVLNHSLKAKDVVVSDAALRLAELSRACQDAELAERLRAIAGDLGDVVLPFPEPEAEKLQPTP